MTVENEITDFILGELLGRVRCCGDPLATGQLDSLSIACLLDHLAERYEIDFGDDDIVAENLSNVSALAALVTSKRAHAAARAGAVRP